MKNYHNMIAQPLALCCDQFCGSGAASQHSTANQLFVLAFQYVFHGSWHIRPILNSSYSVVALVTCNVHQYVHTHSRLYAHTYSKQNASVLL